MLHRNITRVIAYGMNACDSTVTHYICTWWDEWAVCTAVNARFCLVLVPMTLWGHAMVSTSISVYLLQWIMDEAYFYDSKYDTKSFACFVVSTQDILYDRILQWISVVPIVEAHIATVAMSMFKLHPIVIAIIVRYWMSTESGLVGSLIFMKAFAHPHLHNSFYRPKAGF